MRIAFYFLMLGAVCLLCLLRGRSDERFAAAACVVGSVLTFIANQLTLPFVRFEPLAFAVDVGVLAAFVVIALRSARFWPLWVAGLQLTATSVHLLKLLHPDLMSFVVGAALAFWSYPILILIGIGAWRTAMVERWRRELRLRDAA
jgi:hypothetical protein